LGIATIVFDLDGTLADTAPDIIGTLNIILAEENLPALPVSMARELVGAGARALIERGFRVQARDLDAAQLDRLFGRFLEIYAGRVAHASKLYDGVEAALDALADAGHRLAVCTNKPQRHSLLLLEALGIRHRFAAIAGRDAFAFFKPDPRHLLETIRQAGGDATRAAMIGDSRTDIDTARAAGVPVLCVPFGYTDVPIETLAPDRVIAHFDDLIPALRELGVIAG
jgi:phosphoglycolate phosphatase